MDLGMPPDLQGYLARWKSEQDAARAAEAWSSIGTAGRRTYRSYLDGAWTRRGRRERIAMVAAQLTGRPVRPAVPPPYIPGPV